jgi:ammonia channel protein AmtB
MRGAMGDPVDALTTIFTESYYWITVVMMFLIHAGFCTYEVGASRRKNVLHTYQPTVPHGIITNQTGS